MCRWSSPWNDKFGKRTENYPLFFVIWLPFVIWRLNTRRAYLCYFWIHLHQLILDWSSQWDHFIDKGTTLGLIGTAGIISDKVLWTDEIWIARHAVGLITWTKVLSEDGAMENIRMSTFKIERVIRIFFFICRCSSIYFCLWNRQRTL